MSAARLPFRHRAKKIRVQRGPILQHREERAIYPKSVFVFNEAIDTNRREGEGTSMLTKIRSYIRQFALQKMVTAEEIEGVLRLPILAIVPHLERRRQLSPEHQHLRRQFRLDGRWFSRLLIHFAVDHPAASVYATLVQSLRQDAEVNRRKLLVLTSPLPGEGTSLTAANLAIAGHRKGIRVLVVEGDIRSPRISTVLNLPLEPGLTGVLTKGVPVASAIRKDPVTQIDVLPAGRALPYPGALWSDPAFERLLITLRGLYDLVLFETGSMLLHADSAAIAERADGTILIHQFGRGTEERIERAVEKWGALRDSIVGVILNDVPDGWSPEANK